MNGRTTTKPRTPFGERLVAARKAAGFTQLAFAKKLRVNRMLVRHNERKSANPKLNFLLQCCTVLGITLDELVDVPVALRSRRNVELDRFVRGLRGLTDGSQRAVLRVALSTLREVSRLERSPR